MFEAVSLILAPLAAPTLAIFAVVQFQRADACTALARSAGTEAFPHGFARDARRLRASGVTLMLLAVLAAVVALLAWSKAVDAQPVERAPVEKSVWVCLNAAGEVARDNEPFKECVRARYNSPF